MSRRSVVVRRCRVKVVAIGVLVVAFLGTAGTTHAGIIPFGSYSGVGSTPPLASNAQVFTTVTPMNDNSPASNNFIASNSTFTSIGPIDYVFPVIATGPGTPATEYLHAQVTINNTTTSTWIGFHFELGAGTGGSFVNAGTLGITGLDFDTGIAGTGSAPFTEKDPPPSSTAFASVAHLPTTIDWSGGAGVAPGGAALFGLSTDIPDLPLTFSTFTLRLLPVVASVPEPASFLLLGSGLAGLGAWRFSPKRHVSAVIQWMKSAAV